MYYSGVSDDDKAGVGENAWVGAGDIWEPKNFCLKKIKNKVFKKQKDNNNQWPKKSDDDFNI